LGVSAAAARERVARAAFADAWLWTACVLYAAVFYALGAARYAGHHNFVDLGVFSQIAASAFGCFCSPLYGSQWAHHFSPILYVAGIFMHFWRSPLTLVALQAIAGALFVPPVYGLVLRRSDRNTARLAAAVTLLYPPLAGMVFGDFYENAFAPAAVGWLLWAFDGGYFFTAFAFALIALSVKEDQAFFLAVAGVLAFFRYREDRARAALALVVAFVSAATAALYLLAIQPHAHGVSPHWASRFFSWSAAGAATFWPQGILQRAGFVLLAFAPLLFLPFRTPAMLVAVLPLAEVLASTDPVTYTIGQHYAGAWLGYVFYAFAIAIGKMYAHDRPRAGRLLYWCLALCAIEFAVADPLHPGAMLRAPGARDASLDAFLRSLPRNIDVATQEEAYTHLAAIDPRATLLPETAETPVRACTILIDEDFPDSPRLVESRELVARLVHSGIYRLQARSGRISLYRKTVRCP